MWHSGMCWHSVTCGCRCLAACAPILKERKNVHHAVLEALNSNDEVEVQASIHAVAEFCKMSSTFNKGAIDAIAAKLQVRRFLDLSQHRSLKYHFHMSHNIIISVNSIIPLHIIISS